jgi:hypothetical protein
MAVYAACLHMLIAVPLSPCCPSDWLQLLVLHACPAECMLSMAESARHAQLSAATSLGF